MNGHTLKCYLTIGADGYGTLTMLYPIVTPIRFAQRDGVYAQPGDPILLRHLCPVMLEMVLGEPLPEAGCPRRCCVSIKLVVITDEAG